MPLENMDFDTILEKCGNYGRYQFVLLLLFGYTNIISSMHYFSQTIITFTPQHWCYHESLVNLTYKDLKDLHAHLEHPFCTQQEEYTNGKLIVSSDAHCSRWIYEYDRGYESITTELNWVCDYAFQVAVGQSLFYIGSVLGTMFFGFLADRLGRLPALILSTLTGASGDLLTSFVRSFPLFGVGRFVSGLSTDTCLCLMYILTFEYLKPEKRTFGLNIITVVFYCLGCIMSPWVAIWVGTWRSYLLVASLPALGCLAYPLLLCESAQWLITKQDYEKAVNCLKRVAKVNNRTVTDEDLEGFVEACKQRRANEEKSKERQDNFLDMFRTPRLRKFTIILLIKSMVITLAFDTISRNMEGLGSSPFMLFSITSVVYIPAGFTLILLQNKIGRKGLASGSLFIGGIITAITSVILTFVKPDENAILLAIMVGLSRYAVVVTYDAEVQYAAELIPTSVKGQGMSNIHVVGYAFSFLTAYVIFSANFYKALPSIFISVLMFLGSALCLLLPETVNRKLPENVIEGEQFGLNEKWYYFSCIGAKKEADNNESDLHKL